MPLSYRNIISVNKLKGAIAGENPLSDVLKKQTSNAKYVKGYDNNDVSDYLLGDTAVSGLFGFENKKLDTYDPYTTEGAKTEEVWGEPGRLLYPKIDEDVHAFRNILFNDFNSKGGDDISDQYEDPLILGFEISFNSDSPLFNGDTTNPKMNSIGNFFNKYSKIDEIQNRQHYWKEFNDKIFTIFEQDLKKANEYNKPYYINKINGLNSLNKKIMKYGEDKLTITLNEDVRMISWYISELYNNLVYSYKNKRMMIPENLLRFDMNIKISDMRNFILSTIDEKSDTTNTNTRLKYQLSPKSTIMYTLHDCSFNFFNSYNFTDDITMAGFGASQMTTLSELQFEIIFKSTTRWSRFPFFGDTDKEIDTDKINSASDGLPSTGGPFKSYSNVLEIIKTNRSGDTQKSFWNDKLTSIGQTVANNGVSYLDNLETRLREERGKFVNESLQSFRDLTNINKIEPDNVYHPQFNNRINIENAGKALASDLLNNLEDGARNTANF